MSGDEVGRNNVMECNANNINSVIPHALLINDNKNMGGNKEVLSSERTRSNRVNM